MSGRQNLSLAFALLAIWQLASASGVVTRDEVKAKLQQALRELSQVDDPVARVDVLNEAGRSLRAINPKDVREALDSAFELIASQPEIIELKASQPAASDQPAAKPKPPQTVDRDDLFRRFLHVVSAYDAKLASNFVERYARAHPKIAAGGFLWSSALDALNSDLGGSIQLAAAAARAPGVPDVALAYLEQLRELDPDAARGIAGQLMRPALSPNEWLLLLTYAAPASRVPQIVGNSLVARNIAGLPDVSGFSADGGLVQQLLVNVGTGDAWTPANRFLALELAAAGPSPAAPQGIPGLREAELSARAPLSEQDAARVLSMVKTWYGPQDDLKDSTAVADAAFLRTGNQIYKDRSTLLQAFTSARSGDYAAALGLISGLPRDARDSATDAALLYAANSVKSFEGAMDLVRVARTSTHNPFVIAFALLTAAKLAPPRVRAGPGTLEALLEESDNLARQISGKNGMMLRLTSDSLRAQVDLAAAYAGFREIMQEMDADAAADGAPSVRIMLAMGGTYMEFNVPAGSDTVFNLVRKFAARDWRTTINEIALSRRDEIRLGATVAACDQYLSSTSEKAQRNGLGRK